MLEGAPARNSKSTIATIRPCLIVCARSFRESPPIKAFDPRFSHVYPKCLIGCVICVPLIFRCACSVSSFARFHLTCLGYTRHKPTFALGHRSQRECLRLTAFLDDQASWTKC